MFVEDYLPGRPRVYSPPYTFYVLTPEQHAIWITEQLSRWHRQAIEVRDREMQLHETNKQLRALAADRPRQAREPPPDREPGLGRAGRTAAGSRAWSISGEDLVRQAMRNPEFGVGHLEKWAEMLQILKDISGNRMPTVADLLKQAAQAPNLAQASQKPAKQQDEDGRPGPGHRAPASRPRQKPGEKKDAAGRSPRSPTWNRRRTRRPTSRSRASRRPARAARQPAAARR